MVHYRPLNSPKSRLKGTLAAPAGSFRALHFWTWQLSITVPCPRPIFKRRPDHTLQLNPSAVNSWGNFASKIGIQSILQWQRFTLSSLFPCSPARNPVQLLAQICEHLEKYIGCMYRLWQTFATLERTNTPTRWCPPSCKLGYNPNNYRYISHKP